MKRVASIAFFVLVTLLGIGVLWALRGAVVLFTLSLVVAAALRPLVDRLVDRGADVRLALAAVYLASVGACAMLVYVLGGQILLEIQRAAGELSASYHGTPGWSDEGAFQHLVASTLPPPDEIFAALGDVDPGEVARQAIGTTFGLLDFLGRVFVVVALSLYWGAKRDAFERLWLSLLPVESRVPARAAFTSARAALGAQLRAEVGESVVAACVLALAFWAIGYPYWALPAVAVATLRLVPLLGIILSVLVAGLAGLASGVWMAAIAAALAFAVLLTLKTVVAPRVFRAPRLDPILAVLTVLGLAHDYGVPGVLAAPLVAILIQTIYTELVAARAVAPPPEEVEMKAVANLVERAERLEQRSPRSNLPPELASMVDRLHVLLARADQ